MILIGLLALVVAKGRWWATLIAIGGMAASFVVFTTEPSESFQGTLAFKVIEAGLNVALCGGVAALIYGIAAPAKPESWWNRHRSLPQP